MTDLKPVVVAITGASGSRYGLALVEALAGSGHRVILVVSEHAREVLRLETELERVAFDHPLITSVDWRDMSAPIASGSFKTRGMIICPCSMSTLGEIANGISRNLITRAADATIKEGRKLVLVPREMPLSAIHLENMLKLSKIGVTLMPAAPGFYHKPKSIDDLVTFVVGKILDQFGISHELFKRWGNHEFHLEELEAD